MKKVKTVSEDMERRIDLYLDQKLNQEEIDELWTDLVRDGDALDQLKTRANLQKLISDKQNKGAIVHPFVRSVRSWGVYAAAAALLIAAGAGLFMNSGSDQPGVEPLASIEMDYYRSAESTVDSNEGDEAIREAIILANNGQFEEAIRRLDEELSVTEELKTRAALNINAGSILYNIGRYDDAVSRFISVVSTGTEEIDVVIRERAYWYLGNAYFQLNRVDDARIAFQNALDLNGSYSRIAQSYLRALASS